MPDIGKRPLNPVIPASLEGAAKGISGKVELSKEVVGPCAFVPVAQCPRYKPIRLQFNVMGQACGVCRRTWSADVMSRLLCDSRLHDGFNVDAGISRTTCMAEK